MSDNEKEYKGVSMPGYIRKSAEVALSEMAPMWLVDDAQRPEETDEKHEARMKYRSMHRYLLRQMYFRGVLDTLFREVK